MSGGYAAVESSGKAAILPPVRSGQQQQTPLMSSVTDDPISLWLKLGALDKLEQAVLDGYGDQLYGKTSRMPKVNRFLRQVPIFQAKIEEIHRAVIEGRLRDVQNLIDRKKLALCRDHMGASPIHKAVLFGHKDIINYLLDRYYGIIHSRDHRGRTALHYAAALEDDSIYKLLIDAGFDVNATDMYGHTPEHYIKNKEELAIEQLKENAYVRPLRRTRSKPSKPQESELQRGYSAKPAGNRVIIQEMVHEKNLDALEEIVLQGHGDRLLGEQSSDDLIQSFLDDLPKYMGEIAEIHRAAMKGNLSDLQFMLGNKRLAMSRDPLGATPLHKAVMYGHADAAEYLATNFPECCEAKDIDGLTPLHYAAALRDGRNMYHLLLKCGASKLVPDYKGRTADYYLQSPDQINIEQMIKRSQRINANHLANITTRLQAKSPHRASLTTEPRNWRSGSWSESGDKGDDGTDGTETEQSENGLGQSHENGYLDSMPKKMLFRSKPPFPPPNLQRIEVTSANIRKWIQEEDLEKLEGAVLEGHGDRLQMMETDNEGVQNYLNNVLPKIMDRIQAIHNAVSNDDIMQLESHLDQKDYALAKDHLGMAPLHKAVIFGHEDVVKFIIDNFPETINARDREGRTALHFAAAGTTKTARVIYGMLRKAGANPRIKDAQGRTPEYYRAHHLTFPPEMLTNSVKSQTKLKNRNSEPPPPQRKSRTVTPPVILGRVSAALQQGDLQVLQDLVLEGYGKHIVGRSSWNEDVRKFLKSLPQEMENISMLHNAAATGDLAMVEKLLTEDSKRLRAKDERGLLPLHTAVLHNQTDVVKYICDNFPSAVNWKDNAGRTPLHIAAQNNEGDLYKMLLQAGADSKILDQKGRTAEYYLRSGGKLDALRTAGLNPIGFMNGTDGQLGEESDADSVENGNNAASDTKNEKVTDENEEEKNKDDLFANEHKEEQQSVEEKSSQDNANNSETSQEADEVTPEEGSKESAENEHDTPKEGENGSDNLGSDEDKQTKVESMSKGETEEKTDEVSAQASTENEPKEETVKESKLDEDKAGVSKDEDDCKDEANEESEQTKKEDADLESASKNESEDKKEDSENENKYSEKGEEDISKEEATSEEQKTETVEDDSKENRENKEDKQVIDTEETSADKGAEDEADKENAPIKSEATTEQEAIKEEAPSNVESSVKQESEEKVGDSAENAREENPSKNDAPAESDAKAESQDAEKGDNETKEELNETGHEGEESTKDDETKQKDTSNEESTMEEETKEEDPTKGDAKELDANKGNTKEESLKDNINSEESGKEEVNAKESNSESNEQEESSGEKDDTGQEGTKEDTEVKSGDIEENVKEMDSKDTDGNEEEKPKKNDGDSEELSKDIVANGKNGVSKEDSNEEEGLTDKDAATEEMNVTSTNKADAGEKDSKETITEDNDSNKCEVTKCPEQYESGNDNNKDDPSEKDTSKEVESGNEETKDGNTETTEDHVSKKTLESNTEPDVSGLEIKDDNAKDNAEPGEDKTVELPAEEKEQEAAAPTTANDEGSKENEEDEKASNELKDNETEEEAIEESSKQEGNEDKQMADAAAKDGDEKASNESKDKEKDETVQEYLKGDENEDKETANDAAKDGQIEEANDNTTKDDKEVEIKDDTAKSNQEEEGDKEPGEKQNSDEQQEAKSEDDKEENTEEESNKIEAEKQSDDIKEGGNKTSDTIKNEEKSETGEASKEDANETPSTATESNEKGRESSQDTIEENKETKESNEELKEGENDNTKPSDQAESKFEDGKDPEDENEQKDGDVKDADKQEESSNGETENNKEEESTKKPIEVQGLTATNETQSIPEKRKGSARNEDQISQASTSSQTDDRLNELIEKWLREGDLLRLEHVVIAGQGDRLIGRTSKDKQVQEFLDLVPTYMARIRSVHEAVVRGNLSEVKQVLTRKRFALSRDHLGASPLHLAVLHQHTDILLYIISQFPETLDGPDNEGRTPLHYAAVVPDNGYYYSILKNSGANEAAVDKMGHTPPYYVTHPNELTIRDLLEGYRTTEVAKEEPKIVDVWQRPPTAEIVNRLTPSPDTSEQTELTVKMDSLDRRSGENSKGARNNAEQQPQTSNLNLPQINTQETPGTSGSPPENQAVDQEQLQERMDKLLNSIQSESSNLDKENLSGISKDDMKELMSNIEDPTKVKDEHGQTVLHLAASKEHQNGAFYNLISRAEFLLPERDCGYRSARDVAFKLNVQRNIVEIDQYIVDCFLRKREDFLKMLAHEGYEHILNVVDRSGRNISSVLLQHKMQDSLTLLQDIADLQKRRDELHTFIRHGYLEGITNIIKDDRQLITAKSTRSRCSLHIAVLFENNDVIQALIRTNSAAVHISDNLGRTPLHYAMAMKSANEIVPLLLKAGSTRSRRDVRMRMPSYYYVYKQEIKDILGEEERIS